MVLTKYQGWWFVCLFFTTNYSSSSSFPGIISYVQLAKRRHSAGEPVEDLHLLCCLWIDFQSNTHICGLWRENGTSCPGSGRCLYLFLELFLGCGEMRVFFLFHTEWRTGHKKVKRGLKALLNLSSLSPGRINPQQV